MTQKMTKLEHKDAANALVQWFNSQDIGRDDAKCVIEMVLAKLFMDTSTDLEQLAPLLNLHNRSLCQYMADRIQSGRRR